MGPGRADQEWPTSPPRLVPQSDGYADYADRSQAGPVGPPALRASGPQAAARHALGWGSGQEPGGAPGAPQSPPRPRGTTRSGHPPAIDQVHDHDPARHPAAVPHRPVGLRRGEHGRRGHRQPERQHAQPGDRRPDGGAGGGVSNRTRGHLRLAEHARPVPERARPPAGQGSGGDERGQGLDGQAAPADQRRRRRLPGGRREGGKPRARSGQTSEAAGRDAAAGPSPAAPAGQSAPGRQAGRSAAVGGAAGSAEPGPVGLPRRAPQASMAPQLRGGRPTAPAGPLAGRDPEQARSLMSAIQQGLRTGRATGTPDETDCRPGEVPETGPGWTQ